MTSLPIWMERGVSELQKHYFPNVHALNRRSISHQALVLWNDFFQPLIFISEYKKHDAPFGFDRVKGTGGIWLRKHFDRSGRRGNEFYSPSAALYFLSEKVNECHRF